MLAKSRRGEPRCSVKGIHVEPGRRRGGSGGIGRSGLTFSARRCGGAFTLIELLVTLAIVALLIGILVPSLQQARQSSRALREAAAAKNLMLAYHLYAQDNRDDVLPGYSHLVPAVDEAGSEIGWPVSGRYPWRIAPYLNYDFAGLYADQGLLDEFRRTSRANYQYVVSVYPSLGLNSRFVGGHRNEFAFNDALERIWGKMYVSNADAVRQPARLLVFASARGDDPFSPGATPVDYGYHAIQSPYWTSAEPRWAPYVPGMDPAKHGNVDLRWRERAVCAMFDGHAEQLGAVELRDMRRWSNDATRPDWHLEQ